MSGDTVAMPGDPDGVGEKLALQRKEAEHDKSEKHGDAKPAARKPRKDVTMDGEPPSAPGDRGELTPAQYDDDGWGDTPVQMRG